MSTNKDQKPSDKDPLREHELSKKLVKNGRPVDYLCIKGYVGKSDSNEMVRLYLNKQFNEYIELKKNDILHAEEISEEELEFGGTCIWVRKDTELTKVKIDSKKQQAQFMEGEIAIAQLRPEYVSKAIKRRPIPQSIIRCATNDIVQCGSLFAPLCASDFIPCTWEWFCATFETANGPICTEGCPPQTPQCPSRNQPFCPSQIVICTINYTCPHTTPRCPIDQDAVTDPITQLRLQMEKLKQKVKKLEEDKE